MGEAATAIAFFAATSLLAVSLFVVKDSADGLFVLEEKSSIRYVENYDNSSAELTDHSTVTTYRPALFAPMAIGVVFVVISLYSIAAIVWPNIVTKRNI